MNKYAKELARIAAEHGGILFPADVVNAARSPKNPLHNAFDWNDSEAAEKWRLEQARRLIRVQVICIPNQREPVQAYISLTPARAEEGGYTPIKTILSDEKLYEQMKADAARELEIFSQKYARIEELNQVFEAAAAFIKKRRGKS